MDHRAERRARRDNRHGEHAPSVEIVGDDGDRGDVDEACADADADTLTQEDLGRAVNVI